jgi:hypothetical protein
LNTWLAASRRAGSAGLADSSLNCPWSGDALSLVRRTSWEIRRTFAGQCRLSAGNGLAKIAEGHPISRIDELVPWSFS